MFVSELVKRLKNYDEETRFLVEVNGTLYPIHVDMISFSEIDVEKRIVLSQDDYADDRAVILSLITDDLSLRNMWQNLLDSSDNPGENN